MTPGPSNAASMERASPATERRKSYGDTAPSRSLQDFKQVCLLGEGAYSSVYKVLRLADRETYALKKVKLPSLSDKEKQNALNEVRLLASVTQEHIIAYKEAFFDDKTKCLCIVTEHADSGDLFQQITKCQKERAYMRENDVWRWLHGMCQGLKALHDMQILHRDMKCANVFLHSSPSGPIAKLGDFNVSKVAKRGLCMTQTGTPYYASPEVWRDMPYDAKSDMWSLGCVLYEMVALRPPFRAEDMEGLYKKVLRGQYPRIPPQYSQDLAEVIAVLLQVNPRHRPSVDQLLQMPSMRRHTPDYLQNSGAEGVVGLTRAYSELLSTIKLPKNVIDLSDCLPKPRYIVSDAGGCKASTETGRSSPSRAGVRSMSSGQSARQGSGRNGATERGQLPMAPSLAPLGGNDRAQRGDPELGAAQPLQARGDRAAMRNGEDVPDSLDEYLQQPRRDHQPDAREAHDSLDSYLHSQEPQQHREPRQHREHRDRLPRDVSHESPVPPPGVPPPPSGPRPPPPHAAAPPHVAYAGTGASSAASGPRGRVQPREHRPGRLANYGSNVMGGQPPSGAGGREQIVSRPPPGGHAPGSSSMPPGPRRERDRGGGGGLRLPRLFSQNAGA